MSLATRRFGVGARMRRVEDERFVRGAGRYGDDVDLPGQLHAAFVMSPATAGRIVRIDAGEAPACPGAGPIDMPASPDRVWHALRRA